MGRKLKKGVPKAESARTGSILRRISNRSSRPRNNSISSISSNVSIPSQTPSSPMPMANGTLPNGDNHGRRPNGTGQGGLRFGLLEESLRERILLLSNSSDAIKTIVQVLEGFQAEVKYVKDNYQRDQEKDKMIDELNISLRRITLIRDEEIEALKGQVRHLTAGQVAGDREKEKYERLVKELETRTAEKEVRANEQLASKKLALENEYREKETKLRNDLERERKWIEQENGRKLEELMDQKETASKEIKRLEGEVKAEQQKLVEKKGRYADERKGLKDRNAALANELKELTAETLPLEDCKTKFENLSKKIQEVAMSYSELLSPSDAEASESLRKQLSKLDPVFQWTPISSTTESKFLRTSDIQHVILKYICEIAWQPFSSEVVLNCKGARALLTQVSDQLSEMSENAESTWRALTWRALDRLDGSSLDTLVNDIVTKVLYTLGPLIPPNLDTQKRELTEIASEAVNLWKDVQRDRCRVLIDTKPSKEDTVGWASAYVEEPPLSNPLHSEMGVEDIVVFPKVRRIEPCVSGPAVLVPGRAIYADSPILARGIAERNDIQEDIEEAKIRQAAEEQQKQLKEMLARRTGRHSRNNSTVSPNSFMSSDGGFSLSGDRGGTGITV